MDYIWLILLGVLYLDTRVLRKQAPGLFYNNFSVSLVGLSGYLFWLIFGFWAGLRTGKLLELVIVCIFSGYLFRRRRYWKQLEAEKKAGLIVGEKVFLLAETLGVMLTWFLGTMGLSGLVYSFQRVYPSGLSRVTEVAVLSTTSSLLLVFLIYRMIRRVPGLGVEQVFALGKNQQSFLRLWVLPLLTGLVFAYFSSMILVERSFQPATPFSKMLDSISSPGVFLLFLSTALIAAPFLEEIIFRGFFFYVISRMRGKIFTVGVVAFIFAGLHFEQYWGDAPAIVMVTLLGLTLTIFRAWLGTSRPSIVMHYAFNIGMTVIPVLMLFLSDPALFEFRLHYDELDNVAKESLLRTSIKAHPKQGDAFNDLAWLLAGENKNLPEALRSADRALAYQPQSMAFLDTKAEVLYKMGRLEEALRLEQGLIQRDPENKFFKEQVLKFRER